MKNIITLALVLLSTVNYSQIKGTITDEKGKPLPFVNIFEENTYISTTSNEQGKYELNIKIPGNHIILFQYLGYKTTKQIVALDKSSMVIDIVLQEENIILNEVVINPKDNPANEIIRNAIKNKKENSEKTARFKADFYSRGIIRLKDLPKTILKIWHKKLWENSTN